MINWNQVHVRVGNFQTYHRNSAPVAGKGFLYCPGDGLGKYQDTGQIFFSQVEKFIGLRFRNHQHMAFSQRINIEKGQKIIIFCDPVAGYIALYYF